MLVWSRVTVSSKGMADSCSASSPAETSSETREKSSPKVERIYRVFSPLDWASAAPKAATSSRKGGMELELSTNSRYVTGDPACRTVSSLWSAGKVWFPSFASALVMGWSVPVRDT